MALLAGLLLALDVRAAGSLGIPDRVDGYPTNVGLLILGHSTSAQGAYPVKLASALNDPAHTQDDRHYQVFNAVTGGDGGLLWSLLSVAPGDVRYHRATASQTVGESPQPQWCEAADAVRWSCRRAKLEHLLTGAFPIPASGTCADATVPNGCRQPATLACTWYDRSLPPEQNPVTQSLTPNECWQRMDFRVALLQDTTNRSWPLDDANADGVVNSNDYWPSARIRARGLPCAASSGVVATFVDWNCNLALDPGDAALSLAAGWLRELSDDLLDPVRYGDGSLDAVLVSQKPVEMGQCQLWPLAERNVCNTNRHALRTSQQIAATPDRPLDHYYLPTVYWEHRAIETLFALPDLDPRVLAASPGAALAMWERSARCYANGIAAEDWRIPATVPGRPVVIAADDGEIDAGTPNSDAVGCMVGDHVHHNDAGGWMMADVWYAGLAAPLWSGSADRVFAHGFEGD